MDNTDKNTDEQLGEKERFNALWLMKNYIIASLLS